MIRSGVRLPDGRSRRTRRIDSRRNSCSSRSGVGASRTDERAAAHVTGDRYAVAQPAARRHRGRARVRVLVTGAATSSRAAAQGIGAADLEGAKIWLAVHLRGLRADAERRYGGHPSRVGSVSSLVMEPFAWNLSEGWLATRSSLTNAVERRVVDQTRASWNHVASWLQRIEALQRACYMARHAR